MSEPQIDILSAMRLGVSYKFPLTVRSFSVMARPLTIAETNTMIGRVAEAMTMVPERHRTNVYEASLIAKETLVLATKESPTGNIEPLLSHYVLDLMTTDELLALYQQYKDGCDTVNPSLETMDTAALAALVTEVKKSPEALTRLSRNHLAQVAHFLATPSA